MQKKCVTLPDFRSIILYRTSWTSYDDANMLKGGIVYADKVTTVSNSYAEEIKTPFYGEKLEGLMQCKVVKPFRYCEWNRL